MEVFKWGEKVAIEPAKVRLVCKIIMKIGLPLRFMLLCVFFDGAVCSVYDGMIAVVVTACSVLWVSCCSVVADSPDELKLLMLK